MLDRDVREHFEGDKSTARRSSAKRCMAPPRTGGEDSEDTSRDVQQEVIEDGATGNGEVERLYAYMLGCHLDSPSSLMLGTRAVLC